MSNQDESNKNSTHDTTLSEMEERINKRIDDRASDHDRTTRAHIDGIYKAMDLMGEKMDVNVDGIYKAMDLMGEKMDVKVDGIEKSMQKQYEGLEKSMQKQYEVFEKSMQNQFAELKSSITDSITDSITELRELVEKQNAASNKLREDMTKQTLWLFGTLVTIAGIVIAAVALLT